ncbi:MAG: hypothetical protein AAGF11_30335 [Myxococcota bacterium]
MTRTTTVRVTGVLVMLTSCVTPDDALETDIFPSSESADIDDPAPDSQPNPEPVEPTEPLPLVEAEAWRPTGSGEDPLRTERPAVIDCPSAAWGPELGGLEIQTGTCNYFHATQPSLAAIEPGDSVQVVVFHDRLDAAEPAEGHVAIMLDDEVIWEDYAEIPSAAAVMEAEWIADRAWPAGTTVGLHLHNHGYNSWTMLSLSVTPRS